MIVPLTNNQIDDATYMECMLFLMLAARPMPTDEEVLAGRQTIPHGDHAHTISIGWRAERAAAIAETERRVAMLACPYVACTCGYHEED